MASKLSKGVTVFAIAAAVVVAVVSITLLSRASDDQKTTGKAEQESDGKAKEKKEEAVVAQEPGLNLKNGVETDTKEEKAVKGRGLDLDSEERDERNAVQKSGQSLKTDGEAKIKEETVVQTGGLSLETEEKEEKKEGTTTQEHEMSAEVSEKPFIGNSFQVEKVNPQQEQHEEEKVKETPISVAEASGIRQEVVSKKSEVDVSRVNEEAELLNIGIDKVGQQQEQHEEENVEETPKSVDEAAVTCQEEVSKTSEVDPNKMKQAELLSESWVDVNAAKASFVAEATSSENGSSFKESGHVPKQAKESEAEKEPAQEGENASNNKSVADMSTPTKEVAAFEAKSGLENSWNDAGLELSASKDEQEEASHDGNLSDDAAVASPIVSPSKKKQRARHKNRRKPKTPDARTPTMEAATAKSPTSERQSEMKDEQPDVAAVLKAKTRKKHHHKSPAKNSAASLAAKELRAGQETQSAKKNKKHK